MNRPDRFACALAALVFLVACDGAGSDVQLVAKAKTLLDKQDLGGAVIQLKNALAKNPNSAPARLLLGQALLKGGDPLAALIELRRAQEAEATDSQVMPEIARALLASGEASKLIAQLGQATLPDAGANADLKTSLATAHALQGNVDPARVALAAALQAVPGYAPAIVVQARLDAAAGDIDGALLQLDAALAREAGNEGAGLLKGEILLRARNQPAAALESYRAVRAVHPESIAAHTAVVNVLIQLNRLAEAKTDFEQLKARAPRHPDTQFLQAQFAFNDKDFLASREITDRLLAAMPDNLRVLLLAGAAEYRMAHYTLAEGLLGRAVKVAPKLPTARHLLAQTFLRDGLPDKALEVLQPLLETPAADATSLALAGEAYLQAGDSQRSEAAFRRALKLAPEDARLRTSLAVAQLGRGDSAAALTQLQAIARDDSGTQADQVLVSARLRQKDFLGALLAIDGLDRKLPAQAFPLTLRGQVLAQQGDLAGAAASFDKALLKEPKHFAAVTGLAMLDFNAGKPELARQRYLALIKADAKDFRPRMALAELDTRLGAPDPAIVALLREAIKADPTQAEPQLALIDRLLSSGDGQGAQVAAQDATAVLPNDLIVMDALGRAQLSAGDAQRAVSTFKKLASLQPKNALHQVRLADAFIAGKDTAAAAQALRQALEIQPDNLMAQRGLALLAVADKRPQDGVAIARSIQQRLPKEAVGFALEGELAERGKNWGAAAAAYRAALQRRATSDLAIRLHGNLVAAGAGAEADRMAADWAKHHPQDAAFIYYLGDRAAAARDWPRAEAQYRAVFALQPRNGVALNNVAWLLATQRKPGAVATAEQANALLPERAQLLDTLALAQESENQLPKAIETMKRAVELDLKDPMLKLRLARLFIKQGDKSAARKELESLSRLGTGFAGQPEVTALLKALG